MSSRSLKSLTSSLHRASFGAILLLLLVTSQSPGQTRPTDGSTAQGIAPGAPAGSYQWSGFDNINLFNGHLNFRLPLLAIGGRGGAGYQMTLPIEHRWSVFKQVNEITGSFKYYPEEADWSGIQPGYSLGVMHARKTGDGIAPCSGGLYSRYTKTITRLTFTGADGTEYELQDQLTGGEPKSPVSCFAGFNRGRNFISADGSASAFIADADIVDTVVVGEGIATGLSGYLLLPDGTRLRFDGGTVTWMRDRNGNKISFVYDTSKRVTTITDSLARQVSINYGPVNAPGSDVISYKGFGEVPRTISVNRDRMGTALIAGQTIQSQEELFPQLTGSNDIDFDPLVVTSVTLPNNQQYQFRYNSFGELARFVLPTGGAVEYDHLGGTTDHSANGVTSNQIYRRVVERREYPDGGTGSAYSHKATFSRPESSTGTLGYVVTEQCTPSGVSGQCGSTPYLLTRQYHYFYDNARNSIFKKGIDYHSWKSGKEYKTEQYSPDGVLLRRVETTFAQRAPVPWWTGLPEGEPLNDTRVVETITTIEPNSANLVSKQTITYDDSVPFNNAADVSDFGFGVGTPGGLIRRRHTEYVTTSSYVDAFNGGAHLRRLPLLASIYDAGNKERARTTFQYDNYGSAPNHALTDRSGICGFDASFNINFATRGNQTAVTQYLLEEDPATGVINVTGTIYSYAHYDIAGNAVKTIDPRGAETQFDFTDHFGAPDGDVLADSTPPELSGQATYAFVTKVTNAQTHISSAQFDYYTSRSVDEKDPNGIVTTTYSDNDPLDRTTKIIRAINTPAQNQTVFSYDDFGRIVTTAQDLNNSGDGALVSKSLFDGLGRTIESRSYENATAYIAVRQVYDALGRNSQTSNPFRPAAPDYESPIWTIATFDSLGRTRTVTTPDGAVLDSSYSANSVTITDQTGKKRRSLSDAIGRLVRVDEPDASNNLGTLSAPVQPTEYTYDVLGNLRTVTQGSQQRFFMYDSLSRVIRSRNLEQDINYNLTTSQPNGNNYWSEGYQYDSNGNLVVKTDARDVSSHFSFDTLNRLVRRWYNGSSALSATTNNSPALPTGVGSSDEANYFYDSQTLPAGAPSYSRGSATGRLVATTYGTGSSTGDYFAYDVLGRATLKIQQIGTINYQIQRTYNRANAVIGQTYPSGHTVSYTHDGAGRETSFSGSLGNGIQRIYANGILYSPFGGIKKEQLGTETPIYNRSIYNSRGQLSEIRVSSSATYPSTTDWNRGAILNQFSNQCNGPACDGTDNNGNLKRQEVFIPHDDQISGYTNWLQEYDYDSLNRLQRVKEKNSSNTTMWQQEFQYDRWGNRTIHQTNTFGAGINKQDFTVSSTNRLEVPGGQSGTMVYDKVGNLTTDTYTGSGSRTYDAENRMTAAQGNSQVWHYYIYDAEGKRVIRKLGGVSTWQVYGFEGELLAEYSENASTGRAQKEYGYRNGKLLVTANVPIFNVAAATQTSTATASSYMSIPGSTFSPDRAINGTRYATFYDDVWLDNTINVFPDWIEINFNAHRTISEIDIFTTQADPNNPVEPTPTQTFAPNGGITAFTVQYLTDYGWVTVPGGSITGNDKVWRMISFPSVTTTRIRVTVNDSLTHDLSRIAEIEAWGTSASQIPVLADDFDDNVRDTTKWNLYQVGPNPSPTYERNGRLEIQSQYSATESNYGGYVTAATHSLIGKQTSVEVVQPTTANGGGGNYAGISWGDSPYRIMLAWSYIYYDNTSFYYDPVRDRYIRLRDDPATQTVYYESSSNGVTWEVRASRYRGPVSLDYTVRLYNGNTAGWTSFDLVIFDNFRLEGVGWQPPSAGVQWLVADHLGTPRMVLSETGSLSGVRRHDYLPFGEELPKNVGLRTLGLGYAKDFVRQKFTGQERDGETGLDFFINRYYSNIQGRFTSPDEAFGDQEEVDPQSWNLYSYVRNNPLRFVDPLGLAHMDANGNWVGDKNGECDKGLGACWREDKSLPLGGYWDFGGDQSPVRVQWTAEDEAALQDRLRENTRLADLEGDPDCEDCYYEMGVGPGSGRLIARGVVRLFRGAPTSRLDRAMRARGLLRTIGTHAHHIVAHGARQASKARRILSRFGIDVHGAENGVYLPANVHQGLHTTRYYEKVDKLLSVAATKEEAVAVLSYIASELQKGTFTGGVPGKFPF